MKDLRTSQSVQEVLKGAEKLISKYGINKLLNTEKVMCKSPDDYTAIKQLQLKTAISRVRLNTIKKPLDIYLVVPMYHEEIRIAPRKGSSVKLATFELPQNRYGENALLRKVTELKWLTAGTSVNFHLIFVDDLCDRNSGKLAEKLIKKNDIKNAEVVFLKEAVGNSNRDSLQEKAIQSVIDNGGQSIRGGALCLGFSRAVSLIEKIPQKRAIVGYMDMDSSYSAATIGIPLAKILKQKNTQAVTADRQHQLSYIEPTRNISRISQRSPGLIRMKQIVGYLRKYYLGENVPGDTQSGYKLFEPEVLKQTLLKPAKATNFSYDTQLLARISMMYPKQKVIDTFGVVLIDCDELSTANNGETYFAALEIIKDISSEKGINFGGGNEKWLLKYLTKSFENYNNMIDLLEDDSNFVEMHEVKSRIKTDIDTTAVGSYFKSDIIKDLVKAIKEINEEEIKYKDPLIFTRLSI